MFDKKIAIEVVGTDPAIFALAGPDGRPAKFEMLAVTDVTTDESVWWIVAAPEDAVWYEVPAENVHVGKLIPIDEVPEEQLRWLEQKTVEHLEGVPFVRQITFGVVPKGFHQLHPKLGSPLLERGRTYSIMVHGLANGNVEFTA